MFIRFLEVVRGYRVSKLVYIASGNGLDSIPLSGKPESTDTFKQTDVQESVIHRISI